MSTLRRLSALALLTACAGCAGSLDHGGHAPRDASTVKIEIGPEPAATPRPVAEVDAGPSRAPEEDVARISAEAREVTRYLIEQRRAQDVVRALCLNDKLSQLHAAERAASQYRAGLLEAQGSHDEDEARSERRRLALLRRRADRLVEESRLCI